MGNVWIAFLTGLTTGSLSCLAVQGGLLASSLSTGDIDPPPAKWQAVLTFLVTKLFAYTILGFLLGYLGSLLTLSVRVQGWLQITIGVFMLVTVARILDLHPVFRHFVIQPPRWAYKFLRRQSRNTSLFTPALLGFLTILIPCGITQAMMVVAMGSGSSLWGAAIMFAFVLGTSPVFFALGLTAADLMQNRKFAYLGALLIGIFATFSLNGGIALTGSPYTLQNFYKAATLKSISVVASEGVAGTNRQGQQDVIIDVRSTGYYPRSTTLKAGTPVRLTLSTENTQGCVRVFTIPSLNISKVLPTTGKEVIEFTPNRPGRLSYSCGMGMYTGSFNVI